MHELPGQLGVLSDMTILSFHAYIEADVNMFHSRQELTCQEIDAVKSAKAVILPQGCSKNLYRLVCRHCANFFPNYDAYFGYPGKTGQAALFAKHGVPFPKTKTFSNLEAYYRDKRDECFQYPFVFKLSWGGEGKTVFLVKSEKDLRKALEHALEYEGQGKEGFLFQEYVPTGGRSLRIVVIGNRFFPYWRVARDPDSFYSNLAKGAVIDHDSFPDQKQAAVATLKKFCRDTGINLAGFDFIFSIDEKYCAPLFLEINYFFRCLGLGGVDNYQKLLEEGVREWLKEIEL